MSLCLRTVGLSVHQCLLQLSLLGRPQLVSRFRTSGVNTFCVGLTVTVASPLRCPLYSLQYYAKWTVPEHLERSKKLLSHTKLFYFGFTRGLLLSAVCTAPQYLAELGGCCCHGRHVRLLAHGGLSSCRAAPCRQVPARRLAVYERPRDPRPPPRCAPLPEPRPRPCLPWPPLPWSRSRSSRSPLRWWPEALLLNMFWQALTPWPFMLQ